MAFDTTSKRVSDVITDVKRQFGDESGVQITDSDITRWINDGQREIAIQLKHLKKRATWDTEIDVDTYPQPMANIVEIDAMLIDGVKLPYRSFAESMEVKSSNPSATGRPEFWTNWGSELIFYPKPDQVFPMEVFFAIFPEDIVNVNDLLTIPDRNFDSLCDYVLAKAYSLDEETEIANNHRSLFATRLTDQTNEEFHMQNSTYPTISVSE